MVEKSLKKRISGIKSYRGVIVSVDIFYRLKARWSR